MNKTLGFAKFTAIAIALGFFSPTISIQNNSTTSATATLEFSILNTAQADRNDNRNNNRNKNKNKNTNVNVNSNKNTNVNVNVNKKNNKRGVSPLGVLAGVAIGTVIVASAMSPSCTTVIVNGNSYKKCDNTYYQTQGADYIVVKSPY